MSDSQNRSYMRKLIITSAVLALTFIAVASLGIRYVGHAQETAERQAKKEAEKIKDPAEFKAKFERENQEIREALERETDATIRAKLEARLTARERGYELGQREARSMDAYHGAGVMAAKWAKISMSRAIEIALSQHRGTVIQSSLSGEREDSIAYRLVILSDEANNPGLIHVWVNAVDGSIVRNEAEVMRKKSTP